jgi:hypothetical protein
VALPASLVKDLGNTIRAVGRGDLHPDGDPAPDRGGASIWEALAVFSIPDYLRFVGGQSRRTLANQALG